MIHADAAVQPDSRHVPAFLADEALDLLIFGGKGGVGKTTSAVATALTLAVRQPARSLLLVSTDPAHSLADSLAGAPVPANLTIREIDASARMDAFMAQHRDILGTIARRGTFLDDDDIRRFLDLSLPGMDEIVAFMEISAALEQGAFDAVVVDSAPTGHTLRLFEVPGMFQVWLDALDTMLSKHRYMKKLFAGTYRVDEVDRFLLDMMNSARRVQARLVDPLRTRFVPVLLADRLSICETARLLDRLDELRIPVAELVVNQLVPAGDCPVLGHAFREQAEVLRSCRSRFARHRLWGVYMDADEVRGVPALERFWEGVQPICDVSGLGQGGARLSESQPALSPRADNPAPLPSPEVRLAIFGGKGGVGKTSLACATALTAAAHMPGRSILLLSSDPAHSLSDCLDIELCPDRPTPVAPALAPGLMAAEVNGAAEFAELVALYRGRLEQLWLERHSNLDMTFDRQVMERLFDLAPPGVDELMGLSRVMESLARDQAELVIIDSAPTGHLLRLLQMPAVLDGWLKAIFTVLFKYRHILDLPDLTDRLIQLSKSLKVLRKHLADPQRACLYAVTCPTHMAAAETRDLLAACADLGIAVPVLFVNLVTPPEPPQGPRCRSSFCARARTGERAIIDQLAGDVSRLHHTVVYRTGPLLGITALTALGQQMYAAPPDRGFARNM